MEWLLLIYKIPSEPTRLRASVWRKLKNIGAFYLQNSVCILPNTKEHERNFRQLRKEIEEMSGEAYLFKSTSIGSEDKVVTGFNSSRNEEYAEILDKCNDFFAEIDHETAKEHFTYAELEENEEDLEKLKKWFQKVVARDFFAANLKQQVEENLDKCKLKLETFSDIVFDLEDKKEKDIH